MQGCRGSNPATPPTVERQEPGVQLHTGLLFALCTPDWRSPSDPPDALALIGLGHPNRPTGPDECADRPVLASPSVGQRCRARKRAKRAPEALQLASLHRINAHLTRTTARCRRARWRRSTSSSSDNPRHGVTSAAGRRLGRRRRRDCAGVERISRPLCAQAVVKRRASRWRKERLARPSETETRSWDCLGWLADSARPISSMSPPGAGPRDRAPRSIRSASRIPQKLDDRDDDRHADAGNRAEHARRRRSRPSTARTPSAGCGRCGRGRRLRSGRWPMR